MNKDCNFENAAFEKLCSSWSVDDGVNDKYLLWIPDTQDSEEKEFYVLENIRYPDPEENKYALQYVKDKEYVIKYSYTGPWKKGKTFHAISRNGRYVCTAYTSKYGVRCYDSRTAGLKWENKKLKSIAAVKFNRFADNILEVWNKKADVTYINAEDGAIISPDASVSILQQSNYIRTSNNQKYIIIADHLVTRDCRSAMYSVYEAATNKMLGKFYDAFSVYAAFSITNDGRYAVVSGYDSCGTSMVDLSTGETAWYNPASIHVTGIIIREKENELIITKSNAANEVLDLKTGISKPNRYAENGKTVVNPYGEHLVVHRNTVSIGRKGNTITAEAPFFAFTCAIGTPHGFAVSAVGDKSSLQFYDYNGNLLWENSEVCAGKLAYIAKYNVICGYNMAQDTRKIWLIDLTNGKIRKTVHPENCVEAFFDDNCKILCSTGMIYDILQDDIVKGKESFRFVAYAL